MTKNDVYTFIQYSDMEINKILITILFCNTIQHVFNCIESHLANFFHESEKCCLNEKKKIPQTDFFL